MAAPAMRTSFALRRFIRRSHAIRTALYCTAPENSTQASRDPLPVFMKEEVQTLLRNMTGFDIVRVAGPQKVPLRKPRYKLLTDEELEQYQQSAENRMKYRMQMAPFMKAREPIKEVLSLDPELQGLENNKYIFTDITFGVKDRQRFVVVREPDGTLRKASWEERDRINQIYSPVEGRQFRNPPMFEEENLEALLKNHKYVHVLDMACVQFEPDNPEYIRVTHRTFEAIDSAHSYEDLRSTRHFGSMAFYYVWYKKIDYLLMDMINRELVTDAGDLVRLYCITHPDSAIAQQLKTDTASDLISVLKTFCSVEASHKGQLELAIQGYEEKTRSKATANS
ncbi:small ribosomal subunit protein mS22-like isoform X2 [Littorina saxatilis]|uniref:small ribosomal subunit protein mS22-like isoform X2 n=1 Tax=Littorina saxatilis TaxID=31220 RepID=UPI0038B614A7